MTLKSDIDQLAADAVLMHQVVHGDATTSVITAGGPVRSVAKLIADKDAEINISAGGILAQSVAQVGFATQQAIAAGNSLSQVTIAVAQALSAAGTAQTYSTALAAIASQTAIVPAATVAGFNDAVVASCFDDARSWPDGGAAGKRTQNCAWYTEPTTATGKNLGKLASLAAAWAVSGAAAGDHYYDQTTKLFYSIGGTSGAPTRAEIFRGPKKDKPEMILYTATSSRVIAWDATDPSMPMWKVFPSSGVGSIYSGAAITSIAALNGQLFIGQANTVGYVQINLLSDFSVGHRADTNGYYTEGLSYSNLVGTMIAKAGYWPAGIISAAINNIAATVLPDAPLDVITSLPVLTVVVTTATGVSTTKHDKSVVNGLTGLGGMWGISLVAPAAAWISGGSGVAFKNWYIPDITTLAIGATFDDVSTPKRPGTNGQTGACYYSAKGTNSELNFAIGTGGQAATAILCKLKYNPSAFSASMQAAITNTYNSGWQVGDSRAAWLADTVVETVSGTPVIASTFTGTGNLDGWTLEATATNNAGVNMLDATSGAASNVLATRLLTGLTVGKNYTLNFNRAGAYNCTALVVGIGYPPFSLAVGNCSYQFVATAVSHTVQLLSSAASTRAQLGAISLVECSADRSVKANPLKAFGVLNKAPVAAGSQLVAWSGFAAGVNYLEQEYSASLDFGTGDFCLPVWFYPTTANQNGTVWCRAPAVLAGNSFKIGLVNGVASFGRSIVGAAWAENTLNYTPPLNTWTLANLKRVSGVVSLHINSVQQAATVADTNNYTNTAAVFSVGVDNAHANPFLGSLALLRASATPASADQGAYRYETERKLFMPGVQCCIAGNSSIVITSPDFDDSTGILSVPTLWGVTEFVGLQAINSYATTVGIPACISTRSGYKLLAGATGTSFYKPARLLAEELTRTAAQRKAFGARLLKKTFTATAGQTDFDLGIGEEPVSVYQQGVLKDEGAGAGLHTLSDSGFRKTIKLGTGATLNDRVTIFYTQNL